MRSILKEYFKGFSVGWEVDMSTILLGTLVFPVAFPLFLFKTWLFGYENNY